MPKADYIQRHSDKEIDRLAKEIDRIYGQAAREVKEKLADFQAHHKARDAYMRAKVQAGEMTQAEYRTWMSGQVFIGKQWQQKLDDITKVYVDADAKARDLVGGASKDVFCEAANYTAYQIGKRTGSVAFNLYDRKTVEGLMRKNDKLLPEWKIDQPKDYTWNEKRVRNSITQGIIQGESIPDIGARLTEQLAARNATKMEMFARTAVTGAQNMGRLERMYEAQEMGIKVKKKWVATLDNRTRDAHADLDGQTVDPGESFDSILGPIRCPGDPFADPANTYNCRCTLIDYYPEYDNAKGPRRDNETGNVVKHMTYNEWQEMAHPKDYSDRMERLKITKQGGDKKPVNPYENEMEAKGYVGLSGEESDAFMEKYHNKTLLRKTHMNTMEGAQSRRINSALRNGKLPTDEKDLKFMERLDKAITKNELPQDMTLYRGVSADAFPGAFAGWERASVPLDLFRNEMGKVDYDKWGEALAKAQKDSLDKLLEMGQGLVGSVIGDDGFMQVSASSQRNIFGFSDVNIQLHAPKGLNAYISDYKEESEIILARGTKFEVLGAEISEYTAQNGASSKVLQLIARIVQ